MWGRGWLPFCVWEGEIHCSPSFLLQVIKEQVVGGRCNADAAISIADWGQETKIRDEAVERYLQTR